MRRGWDRTGDVNNDGGKLGERRAGRSRDALTLLMRSREMWPLVIYLQFVVVFVKGVQSFRLSVNRCLSQH